MYRSMKALSQVAIRKQEEHFRWKKPFKRLANSGKRCGIQERKVKLTWEAIYDATDIADYIELEFGIIRDDKFQAYFQKEILRVLREEQDWESILRGTDEYTYPE